MGDGETWPDSLDALVAAPQHHVLLFENESVRAIETRVPAGEKTSLHTHRWPGVLYLVQWSDFVRRDAKGTVLLDTRSTVEKPQEAGARWSAPLSPHTFENVGKSEFRAISVELKTLTQTGSSPVGGT